MHAVILTDIQKGYFTNMKDIFEAIGNQQKRYNWLISNYECNFYPSQYIPRGKEFVWIDGEKLTKIVGKNDIQFIWGIFSAFPKALSFEQIMQYDIPIADGNRDLWTDKVKMQNPLADIEIISWDSSLVILMSNSEDIVHSFTNKYPQSRDLFEYNN